MIMAFEDDVQGKSEAEPSPEGVSLKADHHPGPELYVEGLVQLFATLNGATPALVDTGNLWLYRPKSHFDKPPYRLQVGEVYWTLSPDAHCTRMNQLTFNFSVPSSPGLILITILPEDIDAELLKSLVTLLEGITSYQNCDVHVESVDTGPAAGHVRTVQFSETIKLQFEQAVSVAVHVADIINRAISLAALETCNFASRTTDGLRRTVQDQLVEKIDLAALNGCQVAVVNAFIQSRKQAGEVVLRTCGSVKTVVNDNQRHASQAAQAAARTVNTAILATAEKANEVWHKPEVQSAKTATVNFVSTQAAAAAAAAGAAAHWFQRPWG